ncbi:hypothetical protein JCM14469_00790 [Desulfatiferula olefinivorans]
MGVFLFPVTCFCAAHVPEHLSAAENPGGFPLSPFRPRPRQPGDPVCTPTKEADYAQDLQ